MNDFNKIDQYNYRGQNLCEDELAALLFMLLDKLNLEVIRVRATGDAKYDFIIREQDSVE